MIALPGEIAPGSTRGPSKTIWKRWMMTEMGAWSGLRGRGSDEMIMWIHHDPRAPSNYTVHFLHLPDLFSPSIFDHEA